MKPWELAHEDHKGGMKFKDIADKYGVSESAVKQWNRRYWKAAKVTKVTKKVTKVTQGKPAKNAGASKIPKTPESQARPGNKNAVSTGEFETITPSYFDDPDILAAYNAPVDPLTDQEQNIRQERARKAKMMKLAAQAYSAPGGMVIDTVTKTKGLERGEATNATQTNAEASINRALRIETATTRISDGLNRAIGQYHKMSAEIVRAEDGVRYQGLPAHVIGKAFIDINREIDNGKYTFYDFKGGRGSLKSSFCALKLIDRIMRNENMCALAIRQIAETIKDSVFAQIIWAIDILGLTEEFHITKSPMEIKRKSTGQVIYFRGGDNPYKIKSIRPPQGKYIGVLWLEEKDQLGGNEAVRSIYQSAIRGGDGAIVLASYNTPISKLHWINKDALVVNDRRTIHHSHFMDAPKDWLGQEFFDIAEHTKQVNLRAYQHEYDGIAVGSGYTVFENLKIEAIDDGIIRTFDRILNGVDFGWFPDPWAFVRCYLHKGSMTLYIFDESVGNKITNDRAVEIILGKGVGRSETVVCDSAEPKSIQDYMLSGLRRAVGAKKGPGSIDYSFKWLQGLNAIVIDPKRCPRAAQEFSAYEYERDKYGNVLSGYPDRDNHTIDAVRYATEAAWKRGGFVT